MIAQKEKQKQEEELKELLNGAVDVGCWMMELLNTLEEKDKKIHELSEQNRNLVLRCNTLIQR